SGDFCGLLFQLLNCYQYCCTADRSRAATKSADAVLNDSSVAMDDGDVIQIHTEFIRGDLREGSFLALPVRRRAGHDRDFTGWLDAHSRALPTAGGHRLRWAKRANLNVTGDADAHQTAVGARFLLFGAQLLIAGKVESFVERRFVIATVVIQARRRVEREFARLRKIPAANID